MSVSRIQIDSFLTTAAARYAACAESALRLRDSFREGNGAEAAQAAIDINEHAEVADACMKQVASTIGSEAVRVSEPELGRVIQ